MLLYAVNDEATFPLTFVCVCLREKSNCSSFHWFFFLLFICSALFIPAHYFLCYIYWNELCEKCLPFLLSHTHIMVEKVLFWGHVFEMVNLIDVRIMRSPESKNNIFSAWSVCMCVCYQHNSKKNYSRNIKFGILYLYHI